MRNFRFEGKGLTFIQPWASAIAFAGKDIENRTWRTHYRGPLAIHAGGKLNHDNLQELRRTVRGGEKRPLMDLINGAGAAMGSLPRRNRKQAPSWRSPWWSAAWRTHRHFGTTGAIGGG